MTENVITVKQEVEAFLNLSLARYKEAAAQVVDVLPSVESFHAEAFAEIQKLIDAYVAGDVVVESTPTPEQFKVGDKVKLTGSQWARDPESEYGDPYVGQVVTITDIDEDNDAVFSIASGTWYTSSAPGVGQTHFEHYGAVVATEEDLAIKVGDRVRVLEGCGSAKPGLEFKVKRLENYPSPYQDGKDWYAVGTEEGSTNGVWGKYLEKVFA